MDSWLMQLAVGGVSRSLRGMARADVVVDSLDQRCEGCSPVSRRSSGLQVACLVGACIACSWLFVPVCDAHLMHRPMHRSMLARDGLVSACARFMSVCARFVPVCACTLPSKAGIG
ncbi:hypothetical protein [Paraburkholderia diazotrophica]|uniref:hypothetical protein n=1 Tax=Paraburkholderia diazotrophica TaxID=667676 RepID=UPI00319D8DB4